VDNFYLILACLGIGLLLRRAPGMPTTSASALNGYALNVALPAVILANLPLLNMSSALLIPALTPWLLMLLVIPLVLVLSWLLGWSRDVTGALLIILPLGNTAYLGVPLVQSFFGQEAVPYAVVYDQLGSFLALAAYTPVIAALYGPALERPTAGKILARIFTFPPFLALLAGLLLRGAALPPLANQLLDMLAATLIPVVMVAVGLQLTVRFHRSELLPLSCALGIKLLLMPACAWLLWMLLGQEGLAVQVAVFQAAMPPMISAGAIAIAAGLAPRLVAGAVGIGLIVSFISLPVLYWLLGL
jgi:predicted permease